MSHNPNLVGQVTLSNLSLCPPGTPLGPGARVVNNFGVEQQAPTPPPPTNLRLLRNGTPRTLRNGTNRTVRP